MSVWVQIITYPDIRFSLSLLPGAEQGTVEVANQKPISAAVRRIAPRVGSGGTVVLSEPYRRLA